MDTVETAIYKIRVEGQPEVEAAAGSINKLAAAEGNLAVSEETVSRATRTRADAMDKMLARLDPRIRAEQQLQAALAQVRRFEEEGIGSIDKRAQATLAATAKYNDAIARLNKAGAGAAGLDTAAKEADALTQKLAQLRNAIDPAAAAQAQMNAELAEYQALASAGKISASELAQANDLAANRYAAAIAKMKGTKAEGTFLGAGEGAKLSAFQMQNLAFQINDLGTMMASGQNPFVTIMQQGLQIAQIWGISGVGVVAVMKSVGTAIITFISNPLNQIVFGLALAAGALAFFWRTFSGGGQNAEEMLKRHKDLVNEITGAYGKAKDAAGLYIDSLAEGLQSQAILEHIRLTNQLVEARKSLATGGTLEGIASSLAGGGPIPAAAAAAIRLFTGIQTTINQMHVPQGFIDDWNEFREALARGNADVGEYRARLERLVQAFPSSEALKFKEQIFELTQGLFNDERALKQNEAMMRLYNGTATNADKVLLGLAKAADVAEGKLRTLANTDTVGSMADLARHTNEVAVAVDRLNQASEAEIASLYARSPAEKQRSAEERERIGLLGSEIDESIKAAKVAAAGAEARASADFAISEATRQRKEAMEDSLATELLNVDIVGKSVSETTRLTTELRLLTAAKHAAKEAGTIVTKEERDEIEATAAALGGLAQRLAELKAESDLKFAAEIVNLDPIAQKAAQAVHAIFNDEWRAHLNDSVAGMVRFNEVASKMADFTRSTEAQIRTLQDQATALGMGAGAAAEFAKKQEMINFALANGIKLSPEYIASVNETAAAFGRVTEALAKAKIMADLAFTRQTMFLSPEDLQIATQLRDLYGSNIPAALDSAEAAAMRFNNRLQEVADLGHAISESIGGAIAGLFDGSIKSADDFLDKLTKGIAEAGSKLIATRLTSWLEGGPSPFAKSAASSAAALDAAGSKVASATPPLNTAASALSAAAGKLESAAASLTRAASGSVGAEGAIGATGPIGASGADVLRGGPISDALDAKIKSLGEEVAHDLGVGMVAAIRRAVEFTTDNVVKSVAPRGYTPPTGNFGYSSAPTPPMFGFNPYKASIEELSVAAAALDQAAAKVASCAPPLSAAADKLGGGMSELTDAITAIDNSPAIKGAMSPISMGLESVKQLNDAASALDAAGVTVTKSAKPLNAAANAITVAVDDPGLAQLNDVVTALQEPLGDSRSVDQLQSAAKAMDQAGGKFSTGSRALKVAGDGFNDIFAGLDQTTDAIKALDAADPAQAPQELTKAAAALDAAAGKISFAGRPVKGAADAIRSSGDTLANAAARLVVAAQAIERSAGALASAGSGAAQAWTGFLSAPAASMGGSGSVGAILGSISSGGGSVGAGLSAPFYNAGASGGMIGAMGAIGATGPTGAVGAIGSSVSAQVAARFAPIFQGFINDLEATGYHISSFSGYRPGSIIAGPASAGGGGRSFHGFGAALDINPNLNPVRYGSGAPLITNLPPNIQEIANKWGLNWGGSWSSLKDPMHFDVRGYGVSRYGAVPPMATVYAGGGHAVGGTAPGAGLSAGTPIVSSAGGTAVPVSVVDAPAPGFSGIGKLINSPIFQSAITGFSMGYQSQSPVMGGIGGALSGLMSGGPVDAVVGGLAGALGGFLGKAQAAREELERAKEAWDAMAQEVSDFSDTLQGKVKGDLAQSFDSAQQEFDKIATAADAAQEDIAYLQKELDQFRKTAIQNFARGFGTIIKSLESGLGDADPYRQAAEGVAGLREELLGFISDTRLALGAAAADAARDAARGYVRSQIFGGRELTETRAQLRSIKGASVEAVALLHDLGLSWEQATREVVHRFKKAILDLRQTFEEDLQRRINVATGQGIFNDMADLVDNAAKAFKDAFRIGADWTLVSQTFAVEAQAMVDGAQLVGVEFALLINKFPELSGVVHEFSGSLEDAAAAIEKVNNIAKTIVEYVNSLRTGSASTLAPKDRLTAAQSAFNQQMALAQSGNQDAQETITKYSDDLLNAARDYYASSVGFQNINKDVQDKLLALPPVKETIDPVVAGLRDVLLGINETTDAVNGVAAKTATALLPNFNKLDTSVNGLLDFNELKTGLGPLATDAQVRALIAQVDTNGDGQISELELILASTGLTRTTLNNSIVSLKTDFAKIDTSVNGLLDFNEIKLALGPLATDAQVRALITEVDLNGDQEISELETILASQGLTRTTLDSAIKAGPATSASLIAAALNPNFAKLDTSVNGVIDFNEMKTALGGIATDDQLRAIFTEIDLNGNGTISKLESMLSAQGATTSAIRAVNWDNSQQIAQALAPYFNTLDTNTDGILSFQELQSLGIATDAQIRAMIAKVDVNQNGQVTRDELIKSAVIGTTGAVDEQDPWIRETWSALNDATDGVRKHTRRTGNNTDELGKKTATNLPAFRDQFFNMQAQLSQMHDIIKGPEWGVDGTWNPVVGATGGLVTGGIPGVDSVPMMLTPGEYILNAAQTRSFFSLRQSLAERPGSNDNRQNFVDLMRVYADGTNAQIRVLQDGFNRMVNRLDNIERRARIEASREPARKVAA